MWNNFKEKFKGLIYRQIIYKNSEDRYDSTTTPKLQAPGLEPVHKCLVGLQFDPPLNLGQCNWLKSNSKVQGTKTIIIKTQDTNNRYKF